MESVLKIQLPNDELHRRLGGGIPAGSIVLIEGQRGTGKSILSQRLMYGMLRNGYSVTYISSQLSTIEFINQMKSLGYDVIRDLVSRQLIFISLYPLFVNVTSKDKILPRLISEPRLWKTTAVIIDSLSSMLPDNVSEDVLRGFIVHLKRFGALDKVTLLTVDPDEVDERLLRNLEEISTLLIRLNVKVFGGDLKNSATIVKYNNAPGNFQKIIPFRVEPRVGLIVEIASVV